MGHCVQPTIVYVGLARLPQPFAAPVPSAAVELEVELRSRRIVSANTNLRFPGLDRLLGELLVGEDVDTCARDVLLELEVRYSAPFATAVAVAVQGALRRAANDAAGLEPAGGRELELNGARPDRVVVSAQEAGQPSGS